MGSKGFGISFDKGQGRGVPLMEPLIFTAPPQDQQRPRSHVQIGVNIYIYIYTYIYIYIHMLIRSIVVCLICFDLYSAPQTSKPLTRDSELESRSHQPS